MFFYYSLESGWRPWLYTLCRLRIFHSALASLPERAFDILGQLGFLDWECNAMVGKRQPTMIKYAK